MNLQLADKLAKRPVYLLGATSIVGYNVALLNLNSVYSIVTSRSRNPVVAEWPRLPLGDIEAVAEFCDSLPNVSIVVYCDAVCDVSNCEKNPEWAREINVGNLRRLIDCLPSQVRLVYVSSDHVFGHDGQYDEDAVPCPVSLYGGIRVEAEQLALSRPGTLLVRPGLPIGVSPDRKSGHLEWLKYRLAAGLPVTIIRDESRTAMPASVLATRIIELARSKFTGIRHVTATRSVSRVELAAELKEHFDFPGELGYAFRSEQAAPHLGRVHIVTRFHDKLAEALPCPLDILENQSKMLTINNPPLHIPMDEPDRTTIAV